jgi:hypothetical protein
MANAAVATAFCGETGIDPELVLLEGLVFARLAAAHGHEADTGLFVSMVGLLAQVAGQDTHADEMGEAVARISRLADNGSELAGQMLGTFAESVSPEAMVAAKEYAERLDGGKLCLGE